MFFIQFEDKQVRSIWITLLWKLIFKSWFYPQKTTVDSNERLKNDTMALIEHIIDYTYCDCAQFDISTLCLKIT